jgi:DNA-binding PadR family transcriptional regulator
LGADSSLAAISRRFHLPAQVLEPAFHAARDHGYLTDDDDGFELTDQGHEEIHRVIVRTREWLASELSDWGAADDALLSEALNALATRFVDEDADRQLEPAASS